MSKASEWAKKLEGRPKFLANGYSEDGASVVAQVDVNGNLMIVQHSIPPSTARELAHWILETFGDGERA